MLRINLNLKKIKEYKADLLLLSVAISWGLTFLMVQDAIQNVPVYAFLFWRFFIASILMFIIAYKHYSKINMQSIFYGFVLGCILFAGFATQTFGLLYVKSSIVAFITGFNVVFVPFLALVFFKKKIYSNVLVSAFVALLGLYLLTMSGSLEFAYGEILVLICALMFAFHIVLTGEFSHKANVFIIVCFQFLTVTVLSMCFSLGLEEMTFILPLDATLVKAVLITAVFATVYAFLIQTYMQQYTSASKAAIIFTMEPVSAAFFGVYVGDEFLSPYQIGGAILIISATIISEVRFRRKVKTKL